MVVFLPRTPLHFSRTFLPAPPPTSNLGRRPASSNGSLHLASRRGVRNREVAVFCSVAAISHPASSAYGGWDDPGLEDDAEVSGGVGAFRNLFVAMGIADGKYAILFCLGFFSALAVSRVRVWTFAALPFSGFVFVSGVLVGVARGGIAGDLLARIRGKRGSVELSYEKMRDFGELLDELGVKLSELKSGLQRFVDLNGLELGEMKRYVDILDSVSLTTMPLKKIVENSTGVDFRNEPLGEDRALETKSNTKSSKRKREVGVVGSDILQFLVAIFQDVMIGKDVQKTKDSGLRREAVERVDSADTSFLSGLGAVDENALTNKDKQVFPMPVSTHNREDDKVNVLPKESFEGRPELSETSSGAMRRNTTDTVRSSRSAINTRSPVSSTESTENENSSFRSRDDSFHRDMLSEEEDFHALNRDFRFMSMQGSYHKVVLQHKSHKTEIGRQHSRVDDDAESGFDEMVSFSSGAETSLKSRKTAEVDDKADFPTIYRMNGKAKNERATRTIRFRDNKSTKLENQSNLEDQYSEHDRELNKKPSSLLSSSSSATVTTSAKEEFNQILKHGIDLVRQAGECLKGQNDEKAAEVLLYRSTKLLSTAVSMKPGNLLALGQLGNTYLLHGELKLKMSRNLRTLLSRNEPTLMGGRHQSQSGEQHDQLNKEKMASVLFDVCEECEELLIEAGRSYKIVLSYDKNDVRALYNWGLALSFRAQLIADIGPDAAFDADKVYLAAIEKFDAMLSRSNDYAPDALFKWGMALWQRSHLRPHKGSEKIKLLQQAKALFEDVLLVDSDNPHVQEALDSCISELNFGRRLE